MKYIFLLPLIAYLVFTSFLGQQENKTETLKKNFLAKKRNSIACVPELSRSMVSNGIGILPGSGSHHWKVSDQDSAQIYFDQGINMFYSFHIVESLASFVKAQQFDPKNAMLYWAEALAYSPNINDLGYNQPADALKALENASKFYDSRTPVEKGLIDAMKARYSADTIITREKLNENYRDAMAALAKKYASNAEVMALYSDALMVMHPWDLYFGDGSPKEWTGQIVETIEKGLKLNKNHPGLNHYYIHAVEGSSTPDRALANADHLADMVPGASHMVHMPSHIYIRTGDYAKGVAVNVKALDGYSKYLAIYPDVVKSDFLYQYHNSHLMAACAIMNGNYEVAKKASLMCEEQISPDLHSAPAPMGEYTQYLSATPVFAYIRYGKWDELLKEKKIADSSLYLRILYAFGRGMAHARLNHIPDAEKELATLTNLMENNPKLKIRAFNTAYDAAAVAKNMLAGVIAEQKKDFDNAVSFLRLASELEENMTYNEPKDWILPPLPYLGNALMKQGKFDEAEKVFRKDLSYNPNNCWSLKGLQLVQLREGKTKEAQKTAALVAKALQGSDIKLENAVF